MLRNHKFSRVKGLRACDIVFVSMQLYPGSAVPLMFTTWHTLHALCAVCCVRCSCMLYVYAFLIYAVIFTI